MDKIKIYVRAIMSYGIQAQKLMVVEECSELLSALAKETRQRSSKKDIITELADVSIMIEQMAVNYGWRDFCKEKTRKLKRLKKRLDDDAIL